MDLLCSLSLPGVYNTFHAALHSQTLKYNEDSCYWSFYNSLFPSDSEVGFSGKLALETKTVFMY